MRRLLVRPLPGVIFAGAEGCALVEADAPPLLWLIGASSAEEIVLVGALDASGGGAGAGTAAGLLALLEAGLPEGLQVLGILARDTLASGSSPPPLPQGVPQPWRERLQLFAARAEDGCLVAWEPLAGHNAAQLAPWTVEAAPGWARQCARGRLAFTIACASAQDAEQHLGDIASSLPSCLRFRFPGWSIAPTLTELESAKPGMTLPTRLACDGVISVEVLAEGCGARGPTNFATLDAQLPISYTLDFVACIAPGLASEAEVVSAARALVGSARRQLAAMRAFTTGRKGATGPPSGLAFRCFAPPGLGHLICLPGANERATREGFHQLLRLPAAPLLLPDCAMPWAGEAHPRATGKLLNPHAGCSEQPSWWRGAGATTRAAFVRGLYEYSHYMQDHVDDNGWGCAYRSLQTCVSWYRLQCYSSKEVPAIAEIQKLLRRIDEANKDMVIGSKKWIGTIEGMYLLQDYLGVDCRMLHCQDTADMASQVPQMLQHLEAEGTPIMMGAGQYAYTLVGICFDESSGDVGFLIVDPHYTGSDNLKTILQKGWVGWKNLDFFEKTTEGGFINCCLPSVPRGPQHV